MRAEGATLRGALAAVFSFLVIIALPSRVLAQGDLPPVNFTIAFIGDQGLGTNAEAALRLIKNEGADAVLHQGDFDYHDNPAGWDGQINGILGPDFPYFASVGNHDAMRFYGSGGYQLATPIRTRWIRRRAFPRRGPMPCACRPTMEGS